MCLCMCLCVQPFSKNVFVFVCSCVCVCVSRRREEASKALVLDAEELAGAGGRGAGDELAGGAARERGREGTLRCYGAEALEPSKLDDGVSE